MIRKAVLFRARPGMAAEYQRRHNPLWPELEKAAFASPDNALAGPVKTDAGWHLLYVEGHQSGKARSFDEVKANARNQVYQEKLKARRDDWVEELKTKYYVERHDEDVKP